MIMRMFALALCRRLLFRRAAVSSRLPIGRCFLPTLLIDVHLKLAEFQARLGQTLLELILAPDEDCAKIAAIGGELCMHRLVHHGNSHTQWPRLVRGQLHLDSLSHAARRCHGR